MYPIQDRQYRPGIDNLLVLLIGGIPIAMPTVLSVTMAIGSHRLSQQVGRIPWKIFNWPLYKVFVFIKGLFIIATGGYHKENDCN